ncbi:hypothetical protein J6590_074024 [Homalodisca vitripennis]|nr:hypothetical protein J6590_074024 [Homalodisca vitripennis]
MDPIQVLHEETEEDIPLSEFSKVCELVLGAPPLSTKESKRHHTTIQCGPVCARGFGVTTPSSHAEPYLLGQPAGCTNKTTRQGQTTELCISVRHSVLGTRC